MSWVGYGIFSHGDPAVDGRHTGADVHQNELPDAVRDAGGLHDRSARAWLLPTTCTLPAARPALSYATVYPLVMFLRIITPQLLALAGNGGRGGASLQTVRPCSAPLFPAGATPPPARSGWWFRGERLCVRQRFRCRAVAQPAPSSPADPAPCG
ncbi:hypothetical protein L1887_45223 [Cichorium endivia]|nr:hypothetical protein L1887_45223 [Cichorium endivia]